MIRFACPACSKALKAQDSTAGVKISCPACGHSFPIPERAPPLPSPPMRRSPAQGTTCPGCGRFIALGPNEWTLTIECAQCDTRFQPAGAPAPTLPPAPVRDPSPPERPSTPASRPVETPALRPHRGTLILMLGIASVILVPFLGPLAWKLGRKDLQAMQDGEMDPNGMDLTSYGKRMGMFATISSMFVCVLIPILMKYWFDSLFSSLDRALNPSSPSVPQWPSLDNLGK